MICIASSIHVLCFCWEWFCLDIPAHSNSKPTIILQLSCHGRNIFLPALSCWTVKNGNSPSPSLVLPLPCHCHSPPLMSVKGEYEMRGGEGRVGHSRVFAKRESILIPHISYLRIVLFDFAWIFKIVFYEDYIEVLKRQKKSPNLELIFQRCTL